MTAAISIVDDVALAVAADGFGFMLDHFGARTREQPGVELDAANGVIRARRRKPFEPRQAEQMRSDVELDDRMRIIARREFEIAHRLGGEPAGTEFEARKAALVEPPPVAAMRAETACAGAARRPTADNNRFHVTHGPVVAARRVIRQFASSGLTARSRTRAKMCDNCGHC